MPQNVINKQEQHLPDVLYTLIGEFALTFPKLSEYKQLEAKKQLARTIALSYSEYKDIIIDNFTIPFIKVGELKQLYSDAESKSLRNANELIRKYNLEEYRDIIIDNYSLTISALINIAEYCYQQTNNILDACRIYSELGYAEFNERYGNEDYLINFINSWTNFATEKGISKTKAQLGLLMLFDEIDSEYYDLAFDNKTKEGIWSFFPFTIENVNKLIDFIQKFDDFDSDYFKRINSVEKNEMPYDTSSDDNSTDPDESLEDFYKRLELRLKQIEIQYDSPVEEDYPWHSLLCNYYVYLFNKANDEYPNSVFAVCAYSKWLMSNLSIIFKYIPEISVSELQSLLFDYALDKYSEVTTIVDDDVHVCNILNNKHEYDDIVNIIYKLHYKIEISNYELADIWAYFIINNALSYSKHKTYETASILQVAQKGYIESGDIMLPWKYVRFVDGKCFFYHPNHELGENAILPFKYETEKAKKDFTDIGKTILWNFPFIKCKCENGKILSIDEQFANYVIDEIGFIHKYYKRQKLNIGSASVTSKEILRRYKSEQFNFLESKQVRRFAIIPILENVSNVNTEKEEPALLFTVAIGKETCTLVYENVSISKSTYIFIINPELYDDAVKFISSYFASKKINKRAELQYSRDMFNRQDGFLRVVRVIHDDFENWKNTINFYSKNFI